MSISSNIVKIILLCVAISLCGCRDTKHQYEIWDHRTNERFIINGIPYGHPDYFGLPKNFYGFRDLEGFKRHIPHKDSSCRKLDADGWKPSP